MPSTVVHLALAGLLAAGLLGETFSRRSLLIVFAAVVFADLDVFVGLVVDGGHRAVFHTLLIPLAGVLFVVSDTRLCERSWLRERWGPGAARVAWVTIAAYAVAAIGVDLVTGGANPLYPVHDQFYRIDGEFILSNQRGVVQTFVDLGANDAGPTSLGSTDEVHVGSGVDPTDGSEPENVERVFPVVQRGWQLLVVVAGLLVVGVRLLEER